LQRKLVYAGTNEPSFAIASQHVAELMDLNVGAKQIERVTERIGAERCLERDAEVERYMSLPLMERKDKPAGVTAPDVVMIGTDGGRYQIRMDADKPARQAADKSASGASVATQADAAPPSESANLPPDEKYRGTHWREDKIGLLLTMKSEVGEVDPCPEIPEAFVDPTRILKLTRELKTKKSAAEEATHQEAAKPADEPEEIEQVLKAEAQKVRWQPPEVQTKHLTATHQSWATFGPMVATLAWTLGFYQATRKAFLGDGSENNWTLWRKHFSSFTPILDIIHAISYVFAAAMAGCSFAVGWCYYERWVRWIWAGEVEKVIAEMAQRQAELGVPLEGDGETHPRQVLATALSYLQNHKDKMRYADYRRLGLPITSSYVESAVKQFNQRVKGTEKFWADDGIEAVLQLRADHKSDGAPMDAFWQRRQDNATGQRNYTLAA
jgi:hypothetical protein